MVEVVVEDVESCLLEVEVLDVEDIDIVLVDDVVEVVVVLEKAEIVEFRQSDFNASRKVEVSTVGALTSILH